MRIRMIDGLRGALVALALAPLAACDDGDTDEPAPSGITFDAPADQAIAVGETAEYTITGLDDAQAYRITLVVDANITPAGDGTATFIDGDMNGAADAGPSETIGLITMVNGEAVDGAKTVPGGMDDPANPTGVFPSGGTITLTVSGVGAGVVHPVAYHNGGSSTFLEIGEDGVPVEAYAVGGTTSVDGPGMPMAIMPNPTVDSPIAVGGTVDYTVTGLDDAQAYRITLVVDANIGMATFSDRDNNGAADAGPSENIALITTVNGMPVAGGDGAKTVPGGMDDPANPSGVFPSGGQITLTVTGVGSGRVFPVIYHNGGETTFLEIDNTGAPIENFAVAGSVTVTGPTPQVAPAETQTIAVDGTADFTISGLNDGQAYRITLVVSDNVAVAGTRGTFVDGDMNGAADAGPSETIGLITTVNGMPVADGMGAKTVPGGMDDPAMPSGVFPMGGEISLTVTGVGAGTVYPVVYENGGMSTFLEIDNGSPIEVYAVGGGVTVE